MHDRDAVLAAVEACWSRETSEMPGEWHESNPAKGHCDVSSFVAWEHLGGDLVVGEVHLKGKFQEYHYWNRIDGVDLDLTGSQFRHGEVIAETRTLTSQFLGANHDAMRPEVHARIEAFGQRVDDRLGRL